MCFTGKTAISTRAAFGKGFLFAKNFATLDVCMHLCFREYDEKTYAGPPVMKRIKIKQGIKL